MRGSPLKKHWKPGMNDGGSHYLIVIDDDATTNKPDLTILNYVFNNIHKYTYENCADDTNPLQRYWFWRNIRGFIELHYKKVPVENTRVWLLQSKLYGYVFRQEEMFQKIEL
jgi:hypothetical protein